MLISSSCFEKRLEFLVTLGERDQVGQRRFLACHDLIDGLAKGRDHGFHIGAAALPSFDLQSRHAGSHQVRQQGREMSERGSSKA